MIMVIPKRSTAMIEATELLRQAGVLNPPRLVNLIRDTISFLELDLTGMIVLTEAASGPYVVTPIIAALAGAQRIIALTRDSHYATAEMVIAQTRALECLCDISDTVEIHTRRSLEQFAQADIITNLGFVRPIDAEAVSVMKPTAVIPLMCEAWEFRSGDVDLDACHAKGIPVVGTNESYPGLDVFTYSGWLCLKMLFEAQIEVHKSKIVVIGSDKFGEVILSRLVQAGAEVHKVSTPSEMPKETWANVDCIIVADYSRDNMIIGPIGEVAAVELAQLAPGVTVLQFAGWIDVASLREAALAIYPGVQVGAHRMVQTLAGLGPRPVIELHAAGLKTGQIALRNSNATMERRWHGLMQPLCGRTS